MYHRRDIVNLTATAEDYLPKVTIYHQGENQNRAASDFRNPKWAGGDALPCHRSFRTDSILPRGSINP